MDLLTLLEILGTLNSPSKLDWLCYFDNVIRDTSLIRRSAFREVS